MRVVFFVILSTLFFLPLCASAQSDENEEVPALPSEEVQNSCAIDDINQKCQDAVNMLKDACNAAADTAKDAAAEICAQTYPNEPVKRVLCKGFSNGVINQVLDECIASAEGLYNSCVLGANYNCGNPDWENSLSDTLSQESENASGDSNTQGSDSPGDDSGDGSGGDEGGEASE